MKMIPRLPAFWIAAFLITLGYFWITYEMLAGNIFSDFLAHIDILKFYHEHGKIPFPPLYYLTFFGISTVIPGSKSLKIALLLMMGISWLAKYLLTYHFLKNEIRENPWLAWIPFGLLLMFPLVLLNWEGEYWLLGKMTPNLWHNGSTIFVFPFCMLLFWEVRKWCIGSQPNFIPLISWMLLILLIKPSYLFGLIPGLMVMAIFSNTSRKSVFAIGIYSVLVLAFLLGSKWLIFSETAEDSLFYNFNARGDVMIDPFGVWLKLSESPLWDLFGSFPLLIASLIFFGKTLWANPEFRLAFLTFCFGMLVFFLFAESGPGYLDGNFYWQIPISLFLLYLMIAKVLLSSFFQMEQLNTSSFQKIGILLAFFLLHVLSGLAYLIRISESGIPL
ncbi:hypothetical protein [Algoriphagus formosus]|uniref:DUF2029 domain-containing protein n=1 Tax=Algoriphagus formosus TaxID=2007308 RepID=A0A4R5V5Z1_9BACT|nr:hypothetical protein [Algoriphagus aquimaris]TDK47359.1 hypothetical protein E1898_05700 [Algoriphagus aquimaris]